MVSKSPLGLIALFAAAACGSSSPPLAIDLRPRMNAIRADAATIATLLARGRIEDSVAPADRLARADFGAVGELPAPLADHLALYRKRATILKEAATRGDLAAARRSFDDVVRSCADCHRAARPGTRELELHLETR